MKKVLCIILSLLMMASVFAGCRAQEPAAPAEPDKAAEAAPAEEPAAEPAEAPAEGEAPAEPEANAEPVAEGEAAPTGDYKIAIMTGTVSQGEEEFRAAEQMKAKYGDMIVTATYPDNFTSEQEQMISQVVSLASTEGVKALIYCQAVPGATAAIEKAREVNPDLLVIAGVPAEEPAVISPAADVILQADELAMGNTIIAQAKAMGAKTFVHYSFPRHMSYPLLSARRDLMKIACEKEGIEFVDATAPDPTGDAGVPGAQKFILEDVPQKVKEYGKDTAFFSTNCSMQEPLIASVFKEGALFPQQCCPSPYHGYPAALGIEIPEDKQGDVAFMTDAIKTKAAEAGMTGRASTWPVPINMLMVETGTEYAIAYLEGKTNGKNDKAKLEEIMGQVAPAKMTVTTYDQDGVKADNFYMLLCDFLTF